MREMEGEKAAKIEKDGVSERAVSGGIDSRAAVSEKGVSSGDMYRETISMDAVPGQAVSEDTLAGQEASKATILGEVFALIAHRKANPKEGAYTNYLFDKGLDKILKKVGEEASEVIIAAKNPSSEALVSEMTDLFYHVMVLMVERGLSLEEVYREFERRRK